jgi:hypothetical protein
MANETHDAGPEKATDFVQVNSWFPDEEADYWQMLREEAEFNS